MFVIETLSFENVVPGSKALLKLQPGFTYAWLLLTLAGTTFAKSDLERIILRCNEKIILDVTGADLDKINTYKGGAVAANQIMIDLTEHQSKDIASELSGVIGTRGGVSQLQVEIKIAATAVAPELEAVAGVAAPSDLSTNIHALLPSEHYFGAAKTWDVELSSGPASAWIYKRIWLFGANITAVEAKRDNVQIYKLTAAKNSFLQEHFESDPDAAFFCVDFVMTNHTLPELVRSQEASDLRLKVTTSAATTVTMYEEGLVNLNLL